MAVLVVAGPLIRVLDFHSAALACEGCRCFIME
jgi:hypothetical protein